ncbi:hypothetical protein D3C74_144870 [compost metagenome]
MVTINPPHVWLRRPDGEDLEIFFTDLVNHPTFVPEASMKLEKQQEKKSYDNVLAKLDPKKRDEVSKRFDLIQPLILLEKIKNGNIQAVSEFNDKYKELLHEDEEVFKLKQEELISKIVKKYGGSRASIMRRLISNKGKGYIGRKDNKVMTICHPERQEIVLDTILVRLTDKQIEILKESLERDYLNKYRVSKATIHRLVERRCAKVNEAEVKYSTISDIIDRIDKQAVERLRNINKAKMKSPVVMQTERPYIGWILFRWIIHAWICR